MPFKSKSQQRYMFATMPKLAEEYAQQLTSLTGKPPLFVEEISSIVAIHAGPGAVALCLIEK